MKHNKMKRVLAATLSLLTVAGPMTANVGSIIKDVAIVSAFDSEIGGTSKSWTKTTLSKGDYFENDKELNKATTGNLGQFDVQINKDGDIFDTVKEIVNNREVDVAGAGDYIEGTYKFKNVTSIKYIAANTNGSAARKLQITAKGDNASNARTFVIYSSANADNLKNCFVRVADIDTNVNTTTFTFGMEVADVQNGYQLDLEDVAPYLEKVVYTFQGNKKKVTNTGDAAKALTTIYAKAKTDITIVSTALLTGGSFEYMIPTYSDGQYTYTFKALNNIQADIDYVDIDTEMDEDAEDNTAPDIKIINTVDTKEEDWDAPEDDDDAVLGETITVRSDRPFVIEDGAIKAVKNKNNVIEITTQKVVSEYKDNAFTATFVVAGDMTIVYSDVPENLVYSGNGTQTITANATVDGKKVVENATVASVKAVNKIPVYADADKTAVKVDEDGERVYTESAISKGASLSYNKDPNAFIQLDFNVDKNLLGTSGATSTTTEGLLYQVIITKDASNATKKVVDTYSYNETTGAFEHTRAVGKGDAEDVTNNTDAEFLKKKDSYVPGLILEKQDAGTYAVELRVWGTDATQGAYVAKTNFTIKKATDVTESDFTFRAFYSDERNVYVAARNAYVAVLQNKDSTAEDLEDAKEAFEDALADLNELTVTKKNGIYEVACEKEQLEDGKSVTIYAELPDGTDCDITGDQTSSNQTDTNNIKLVITNPNYNVADIKLKWKNVEKEVVDSILFNVKEAKIVDEDGDPADYDDYVAGDGFVPANKKDLEKVARKYLTSTNNVDVSGATFKYTLDEPLGADGIVDIDALKTGLPSEDDLNENDLVYIYANVGNLATAKPLQVLISETEKEEIETILTKKSFVFGETIQAEDIAFVKAGTDTVIEGLKLKGEDVNGDVEFVDDFTGGSTKEVKYTIKGYDKDGKLVNNLLENEVEDLVPGKYQVTVQAEDTAVDSSDYTVLEAAEGKQVRTFEITVAKKTIDASMFPKIEVEIEANGSAKLTDADFAGQFAPTGVIPDGGNFDHPAVIIDGLTSSATEVGSYSIRLAVANTASDIAGKKWSDLYTGKATVQWRAVKSGTLEPTETIEFVLDDDGNYAHDNIYSDKNGVSIHVDVQLFDNGDELTLKEFEDLELKEYGFVYEKAGVLKDLKEENADDLAEADKYLQLGFANSVNTIKLKKTDKRLAGLNSVVSSVDDYIWVKPYYIDKNGYAVYGQARRLDFKSVAQKVIDPQLKDPMFVQKDNNLYYYAYASKTTKEDATEENLRTADPKEFGVVISRNGNYANLGQLGDDDAVLALAQKIMDGEYVDTTEFTKPQQAAYDELKKACELDIVNRDVQSHAFANNYYTADECGTLIRITDSLSRIYVRTYVDFGYGLVVYSTPKTAENASSILADYFALDTIENTNNQKYYMAASRAKNPDRIEAAESVNTLKGVPQVFQKMTFDAKDITAYGVIIDKNGNVVKQDFVTANFALGHDFIEMMSDTPNKSTTDDGKFIGEDRTALNTVIYGTVAQIGEETVSVRSYLKFKGIDIYGDIESSGGADSDIEPIHEG